MKSKDKKDIIIGIDTSCYTTSIAAISLQKEVILNEKTMLVVKKDQKGLRQSEGVFQHINNLGAMFESIKERLSNYNIVGVSVSTKPRPIENSYMPVFMAGYNFAKSISSVLNVKLYETTHQENHIEACFADNKPKDNEFLSVHMSGGTTEILLVNKKDIDYKIEIVGATKDISFGQLIDRIGINLGYDFPCGKYIDQNAINCIDKISKGVKTSVKDGYMNISGIENQINKLIDDYDENYISKLTLDSVVKNLYKSITYISQKYNINDVYFAGGVSASKYIRENISKKLKKHNINAHFTLMEYCTDNAVGCGLIGVNMFLGEKI